MDFNKIAEEVIDVEIEGLNAIKANLTSSFSNAVESILEAQGRLIVVGMGKSGIIGKKIAATFASTGTRSFFIHPGEAYHGDLGMIHEKDIILAISNSGETDEVVKLLSFFKDNGNKVIAMTSNEDSTLGKNSDFFLNISVPKEACPLALAPTTSTTVTLCMGDALAVALMNARGFQPENFAKFHPGGSLGRKLLTKVRDVMISKDLPMVNLHDKFEKVINTITSGRIGICLVMENNYLRGVISDGDIRRGIAKYGGNILEIEAIELMSSNPTLISSDEKLLVAEEVLRENKITNLIVGTESDVEGVLQIYML